MVGDTGVVDINHQDRGTGDWVQLPRWPRLGESDALVTEAVRAGTAQRPGRSDLAFRAVGCQVQGQWVAHARSVVGVSASNNRSRDMGETAGSLAVNFIIIFHLIIISRTLLVGSRYQK